MPLTYYVVHVRGWGRTTEESNRNALKRLDQFNADAQAGRQTIAPGTAYRVEEPGNGGPCGPVAVRTQDFPYLIAIEDLPEYVAANPSPKPRR